MPTQKEIAEHLGLDQSAISKQMHALGLDWKKASLSEIRLAYCAHLRSVAAGHKASDGTDLTMERALTERIDRQIKELTLREKLGHLVNVSQLEGEMRQMVVAFRSELLQRDDKLKSDLDSLYDIDIDMSVLKAYTYDALNQLARYDPEQQGNAAQAADRAGASSRDEHDGMGAGTQALEPESDG